MLKWPDKVPILSADDMVIGPLRRKRPGCGCLVFHALRIFPEMPLLSGDLSDALVASHDDFGTCIPDRNELTNHVQFATTEQDTRRVTKSLAARIWNRAMAKLGYIYDDDGKVINPECTKSGKLKLVK